jgi:hypothetical protein
MNKIKQLFENRDFETAEDYLAYQARQEAMDQKEVKALRALYYKSI